jgi:arsenite oxidase small subunit
VGAISDRRDAVALSRRDLLKVAAAGAAGGAVLEAETADAAPRARTYPRHRISSVSALAVGKPVSFQYPLRGQQSVLIDTGRAVPGGVGPNKSIVAYSALCQHMGCPVAYDGTLREFVCPCHQTRYDPERLGSIVLGVATRALPRVLLEVSGGALFAVGVDGLIYGYRTNLAPGRKVGS